MNTEPTTAVVERVLAAPPDLVYDEWLDPEAMLEWMCPRPARPTHIEIEPKVGGRLRIDIVEQGFWLQATGTYLQLGRPRLLRFTWRPSFWAESDPDSLVTVTLDPHGNAQTLMTIRHVLLPPGMGEHYEWGWGAIARQLDDTLLTR